MMKSTLLEREMEELLGKLGYNLYVGSEDDATIDSSVVVDSAMDLGYTPYVLSGEGQPLNETLVFVKEELGESSSLSTVLKCSLDDEDVLMTALSMNDDVVVISTDYEDDGEVFVVEFSTRKSSGV